MQSIRQRTETLRSFPVLASVPRRRLRDLLVHLDEVDTPDGATLIEEGSVNRHSYLVVAGSLVVTTGDRTVAEVGPGSIVGERSAMTHEPANATVVAAPGTTILVMEHRVLRALMHREPTFARELTTMVGQRDAELAAA